MYMAVACSLIGFVFIAEGLLASWKFRDKNSQENSGCSVMFGLVLVVFGAYLLDKHFDKPPAAVQEAK